MSSSSPSEEVRPKVPWDLRAREIRWRDRQPFLQERGYMLRQRYRPGWIPSWIISGESPGGQEDYYALPPPGHAIDAVRIADGKVVFIKCLETGLKEIEIANYFSQPPQRDDPRNHCVPILDTFEGEDPSVTYIVMPFLRRAHDPPFHFVDDVVKYVDQLMEGLVFLHEHHVAHRDCAPNNLMMDASSLFPKGFHPFHLRFLPDLSDLTPYVHRIAARPPVKYYYVDFGISSMIPPDSDSKLVSGQEGLDPDVPELAQPEGFKYDPFKVDVFVIGNVLRRHLHGKFMRIDFLLPLAEWMTQEDPKDRPTAVEASEKWRRIRRRVWPTQRARRLRPVGEPGPEAFAFDIRAFFELGSALVHRYLRIGGG